MSSLDETRLDQGGWQPSAKDMLASRRRLLEKAGRLLDLIKTDVPPAEIEEVLVDVPVVEGNQVAIGQARALRWKDVQLRTPVERQELEDTIVEIRSMGMGFGPGTHESKQATSLLCIALKDASEDIRVKTANALVDWGEPSAIGHLEKVWNGPTNQTHLSRLYTPSFDGLSARYAMKDIAERFPQTVLSDTQRTIIETRI